MSISTQVKSLGWYEINSEGIGTIYLCIEDEGMVSGPSDTPANKQYAPRVQNPESFSIKRAPAVWMDGDSAIGAAAFGQLDLGNYDGAYNFLVENDVRDFIVIVKIVAAATLLTGTAINSAPTVCTGIIDRVSQPSEDVVSVTIKDTLARLDRQLPCRFNPPFVEDGAANRMIPLTFGAVRNRAPLLIDAPNRLFQLHDANIPSVTLVADKAAPLDPSASPPQYTPAISGSGIQLNAMPVGKLTVDCSSYGTQSIIPGAQDILNDDGLFLNFNTAGVPENWVWSAGSGSSISHVLHANAPWIPDSSNAVTISSAIKWDGTTHFGDHRRYPAIFKGGVSYRINFGVYDIRSKAPTNSGVVGGLMVATKLTGLASDYLAGVGTGVGFLAALPITQNHITTNQNFSFEFTCPPGADRNLYFIACPSMDGFNGAAIGTASAKIYDVRIERLGQYTELPLAGMPFDNYLKEILVNRANENGSVFNSSEASALTLRDDGSIVPWGITFDSPPNILDAIRAPLDSFRRATMFTDSDGILRFRRMIDPSDPANASLVLCDFDTTNIKSGIQVAPYDARGATTLVGARPNQSPFGASDFVTDQAIVPQNIKTRFMRKCQFERTSSVSPAGQYSFAIGAPIFNTLLDDPDDAQDMIDESTRIISPQVYSDGTFTNGKLVEVTFIAFFDDPAAVGVTVQCGLNAIMYGEVIRFTYPNADGTPRFVDQLGIVRMWNPYPFGQKVEITILTKAA
jgi:hypothetical protein